MRPPPLIQRDFALHPPALTPAYKTSVLRAPRQPLLAIGTSLTEATGPVFGHADLGALDHDLIRNAARDGLPIGERIHVHGRVTDEHARPVRGTLVEIWQANAGGRYRHRSDDYLAPLDPNFGGCGRTLTDDDGRYWFHTIKPGAYPWPNDNNAWRPAHIHFSLFGSGFAQRLITQMYFEGDPLIARCAIANTVADKAALARLVAPLDMTAATGFDSLAYRFDIVLRGSRQTFFENKAEGN